VIYSTPAKEFDGVTTGLKLLETAVDLIALRHEDPDREAEHLQEAANLIQDAWLAVQAAAGKARDADNDLRGPS
jgi:hypothetical protein